MKRCPYALVLTTLAAVAPASPAGILFNRHPKPNPSERVPILIAEVKTGTPERKREAAAEELGKYDPNAFPEIVPILAEVAQQDASAAVRLEALKTLTHLRPVSQPAGWALEQAAEKDAAFRVRMQARTLLWQYHLAGYRTGGKGEPPLASGSGSSKEPPLAAPAPVRVNPSGEPPLADPKAAHPLPVGRPGDGPALTHPE